MEFEWNAPIEGRRTMANHQRGCTGLGHRDTAIILGPRFVICDAVFRQGEHRKLSVHVTF